MHIYMQNEQLPYIYSMFFYFIESACFPIFSSSILGSKIIPLCLVTICRCSPVARPVEPDLPMMVPAKTGVPGAI